MTQQAALFDVDPSARREHDFYQTPSFMTVALLKRIPIRGRVLECCAGEGAITRVLQAVPQLRVSENEPYQDCPTATWRLDATKRESWERWRRFDWIVSNPPFNLAEAIVPLALEHARVGVAMVLRLSWFEPTLDRGDFLKQHPPALINMPRHDFRGDGKTDSVTSAWFIWLADEGARQFGRFPNDVVTPGERDALIAAERMAR